MKRKIDSQNSLSKFLKIPFPKVSRNSVLIPKSFRNHFQKLFHTFSQAKFCQISEKPKTQKYLSYYFPFFSFTEENTKNILFSRNLFLSNPKIQKYHAVTLPKSPKDVVKSHPRSFFKNSKWIPHTKVSKLSLSIATDNFISFYFISYCFTLFVN